MNETPSTTNEYRQYRFNRGPYIDVYTVHPSYVESIESKDEDGRRRILSFAARGMGSAWWVTHEQIRR